MSGRMAWTCVKAFSLAVCALFLVQAFVGEISIVPTPSMEGTILVGDHLLLNKALYGPQIPLTSWRLPRLKKIRRGDIVTFRYPRNPALLFVKRVVAFGGESVEIRQGTLYVNAAPVYEPYVVRRGRAYNMAPRVVPAGELFVLGDNRDNSDDSRFWGAVPMANVVGEPWMVFWSYEAPTAAWLDKNGNLRLTAYASVLRNFLTGTRWSRSGLLL